MLAKFKLIIEVIKDNEVIKTIEKDLIMRQAFKMLYDILISKAEYSTYKAENGSDYLVYMSIGHGFEAKLLRSIAIGTGKTAPNFNDYKLENKIAEAGISIQNYTEDIQNNQIYFDAVANFNINQQITIYEFGIFGQINDAYTGDLHNFLVCRDVIPEGVNVPAGSTLKITYRITLSQ
ncbi:MAG: hypothetical protein QW616_05745 [Thermoplasmata archaeon]